MVAICWFCNHDVDGLENPKAGHVADCPMQKMKEKGLSELEVNDIVSKIREDKIWDEKQKKWKTQMYRNHGERTVYFGGLIIDLKFVNGKKIHGEQKRNLSVTVWDETIESIGRDWKYIAETEMQVD